MYIYISIHNYTYTHTYIYIYIYAQYTIYTIYCTSGTNIKIHVLDLIFTNLLGPPCPIIVFKQYNFRKSKGLLKLET